MTECPHTVDGKCDRRIYLGEVFDPEDYQTPCHTCPLDDLPVGASEDVTASVDMLCAVCGENHVAADDHPVCKYCQSEELREAIDSGAMDQEAA